MNILDLSAASVAKEIKAGKITAVEVMQAVIDRIDTTDRKSVV